MTYFITTTHCHFFLHQLMNMILYNNSRHWMRMIADHDEASRSLSLTYSLKFTHYFY
ncbi:unnamed protein product [Amoebophrya sp. A25]|nr:unnamed protein product [Amoebophrya sp. A25]|eukprot:GSA25T00006398001.1